MRWTGNVRWLFLGPAVIWLLAFTIFPLFYSLYLSVNRIESKVEVKQERVQVLDAAGQPVLDPSGQPSTRIKVTRNSVTNTTFVGLSNFKRLFTDPQVFAAIKVSAIFILAAVPAQLVLGLLLALLFNRQMRGRGVLRVIMLLPIFAAPVAVGYIFFTIFYEEGGPLGFLRIPFLSNPNWALFSVIVVDIWQWTPFCFLVFLAGLQSAPTELVECARLDTNSRVRVFFHVILPHLRPTILIVFLLRLAEGIKLFDVPFALTGGGPGIATQSMSFLAYRTGLRFFDFGYASAMAYCLLALVMVIVTLFFRRVRNVYA